MSVCETSAIIGTAVGDDNDSRSVSTLDINDSTRSIDVSLNIKYDAKKVDEESLQHTVPSDAGGWRTSTEETGDVGDTGGAGDASGASSWGANANVAIATASVLLAVVIVAVVVAVAAARGPLCRNPQDSSTWGLCNSSQHN